MTGKSTERVKRYRERQRTGGVILTFELGSDDLVELERLGFLPPGRRSDKDAIEKAAMAVWQAGLSTAR